MFPSMLDPGEGCRGIILDLRVDGRGEFDFATIFVKSFVAPSKMVQDLARDGTDFLLCQVELGKVNFRGRAMVIRDIWLGTGFSRCKCAFAASSHLLARLYKS